MSNIIELNNVVFKRSERAIMDGLSLNIVENKLTALMGPSGVGKTTMLKLITAQERPLSGVIRVFGNDVQKLSRKALFAMRKRIGVLFQSGALLGDLNVFDNVALPLKENTRIPKRSIYDLAMIKLEAVGLRGTVDLYPRELSGGMLRRVALARSLALDPEIIMYDEPFVGQDPITMGVLIKLIDTVSKNLPITSVAISHDVQEILSIADFGYLLTQGKALGGLPPEQLLKKDSDYMKQFLSGLEDGPVPFHFPVKQSLSEDLI